METTLTFDAVNHIYRIDGQVVPSVTQVLKDCGIIDTTWYTGNGCDRGSAVHLACHYLDTGTLDRDSVDERIKGYVEAYERFKDDTKAEIIETEKQVSSLLGYAGTLDKLGILGGDDAIIDIKTGLPPAWAGLQTAGYALCLGGTWKRYALQLKSSGKYSLKEYKDRKDKDMFLACLNIYNWKHNNGGVKK